MKTNYNTFKLYLEGYEVGFNQISLNESGFSPSICTITIPANPKAMDLLPGTIAHLFYSDNGKDYFIIFEGELVNKSFSKSVGQEFAQLQFVSIINTLQRSYQTPSAFISNQGSIIEDYLLIDSSGKEGYKPISSEIQRRFDNFINPLLSLKNYFSKIKDGLDGDNSKLIEEAILGIFKDAEVSNEWYGYFSEAYKIKQRLLAFPNELAESAIFAQVENIFARSQIAPSTDTLTALSLLYRALGFIGYSMIQSSAPAFGSNKLKSYVFLPSSDYLAPVRCNIFFGDAVQSAGFTQSFLQENTRLALSSSSLSMLLKNSNYAVKPTFIAPEVNYVDSNSGRMDYSLKEQYLGIVPGFSQLNGIEQAFANSNRLRKNEENDDTPQSEINEVREFDDNAEKIISEAGVTNHIKKIAIKQYWDNIYKTRTFNISTVYNPNRMVGFSGIFIDKNVGSVVGTIKSINTVISAKGGATSSIVFISPRIVWDFNESGDGLDSADVNPSIQVWFDEKRFGFDNIGKNVYSEIIGSDSSVDSASIFYFKQLKNYQDILVNAKLNSILNSDNSLKNTLKLSMVVHALKNHYYNLPKDSKQRFEDTAIKRTLLSEKEYWSFLLSKFNKIDDEKESKPNNYKESDIYRDLDKKEYISITNKEYETYKPFILNRLKAVKRLLNVSN